MRALQKIAHGTADTAARLNLRHAGRIDRLRSVTPVPSPAFPTLTRAFNGCLRARELASLCVRASRNCGPYTTRKNLHSYLEDYLCLPTQNEAPVAPRLRTPLRC